MKRPFVVSAAHCLLLVLPSFCFAAAYQVTDLGTLGGSLSAGSGINASGQVTGYAYLAGDTAYHAFLYDGAMHDLGTLGGTLSQGFSISANGQVVGGSAGHVFLYDGAMNDLGLGVGNGINNSGQVTGTSSALRAFRYDGTMHDLGTLGGSHSEGFGINDMGQVTGTADTISGDLHAFRYDVTMHDLGTLGGARSQGFGINASGHVTGSSWTTGTNVNHAFLNDGSMHDLGTLAGIDSVGYAINASGQVTGTSRIGVPPLQNPNRAFLYDSVHGMIDLNSLIDPASGWILHTGSAINDLGQITGYGTVGNESHAFLLTPVPEPSSFVLVSLATCAAAAYRRWPVRQIQRHVRRSAVSR